MKMMFGLPCTPALSPSAYGDAAWETSKPAMAAGKNVPKGFSARLKNSGAGLRPAMNGRLPRENSGARRPKGRRDACPTTFSIHVLMTADGRKRRGDSQ